MSRRQPPQVKEDVTCNLIPMIDIMFLLLLFFMLSADMTQREFEDIVLPSADQVQESEKEKGESSTVTVNIFHRPESGTFTCPVYSHNGTCRDKTHWLYAMRSQEYTAETLKDQLKQEADAALEPEVDPATNRRMSSRILIIRADRLAPYGDIQKVMQYCGEVGLYKIEVAVANPLNV